MRIIVGSHCAVSLYVQAGEGLLWHTVRDYDDFLVKTHCGVLLFKANVKMTIDKPEFGDCLECLRRL